MNSHGRLAELNARVQQDLDYLNYPPANWSSRSTTADGQPVSDVVIIGGGMCGMVAWLALTRAGIANLRIPDRAPRGPGGSWVTFARMETCARRRTCWARRFGMASLTFAPGTPHASVKRRGKRCSAFPARCGWTT